MAGRTIAIGDIHGCADALDCLIDAVAPGADDVVIMLGDYIDRGPQSRKVVDRLIRLNEQCQLIALLGDHEEMLLDALKDPTTLEKWLSCGGTSTLHSYGWKVGVRRQLSEWIPETHQQFLRSCHSYHESPTHLFMHAGYVPELSMSEQPSLALLWRVTNVATARAHCSGKVVIVGHTPQLNGEVLNLGFLICIDTNCVRGGWLTALDISNGMIWQSNQSGTLRFSQVR